MVNVATTAPDPDQGAAGATGKLLLGVFDAQLGMARLKVETAGESSEALLPSGPGSGPGANSVVGGKLSVSVWKTFSSPGQARGRGKGGRGARLAEWRRISLSSPAQG